MPSATTAPSAVPTDEDPPETGRCISRAWYGLCKEWEGDDTEGGEDM